jgi:hypothetical protein
MGVLIYDGNIHVGDLVTLEKYKPYRKISLVVKEYQYHVSLMSFEKKKEGKRKITKYVDKYTLQKVA